MRVAASVKGAHATAALVVGKLGSAKRQQNALTAAIKENGALRRTVCARYLHALRRSLAYAGEGALGEGASVRPDAHRQRQWPPLPSPRGRGSRGRCRGSRHSAIPRRGLAPGAAPAPAVA